MVSGPSTGPANIFEQVERSVVVRRKINPIHPVEKLPTAELVAQSNSTPDPDFGPEKLAESTKREPAVAAEATTTQRVTTNGAALEQASFFARLERSVIVRRKINPIASPVPSRVAPVREAEQVQEQYVQVATPPVRVVPIAPVPPAPSHLATEPIHPQGLATSVAWQDLPPPQIVPARPAFTLVEPQLEEVPPPSPKPEPNPPRTSPAPMPVPSIARQGPKNVDPGLRPIGSVGIGISQPRPEKAAGGVDLPEDLAAKVIEGAGTRHFETEPFQPWGAYGQLAISPDFCHRPLYFEDVNLERYGRSWGAAQPFVSAGKFFATVPLLPYKMVREPPGVCRADIGPPAGAPAPRQKVIGPLEIDATVVEVATIAAIILLFP